MNDEPDPKPVGRRARNRAARAAFAAARNRGLVLRHRAKLAHLRERASQNEQPTTTTEENTDD